MESPWSFTINMFAIATRDSYAKAYRLSNYHDAALAKLIATNHALQVSYDRYHPLHEAFTDKYNKLSSASGMQKGQSLNVKQQLKLALEKLELWDITIQLIHRKKSPRYKELFPGGHKPFRRGGLDSRINAFDVLSRSIGNEIALATLKAEIDASYQLLDNARDTQESAKGTRKQRSGNLKTTCRDIMNMQYRNACWISDNFFDTRATLCNALFDLQTLRDKRQRHFTATLKPHSTKPVLVRTFTPTDLLQLKLDSQGTVSFYLATTRGGINSNPLTLHNKEDKEIILTDFGVSDYSKHRFLTVVNEGSEMVKVVVQVV
jgi:hypothetical protein